MRILSAIALLALVATASAQTPTPTPTPVRLAASVMINPPAHQSAPNVLVAPTATTFYTANPPPFSSLGSVPTARLLGRYSAGTGAAQAITIGSGLSLSGAGELSASGGGTGTVTSVALTLPNIFSVTGSPVTTSGTLAATLATQSANTVFAGPSNPASEPASPSFRALVLADLPAFAVGDLSDGADIPILSADNVFAGVNRFTAGYLELRAGDGSIVQLVAGAGSGSNQGFTLPTSSGTLVTTSALGAYQPLASALTSWGSVTRASGFDTFTATPSSANLRGLLTDETGTGAAVFATSPTLVTPTLGAATATTINGNTITTGTGTLTLGAGKTLTASNTLTLTATDGSTLAIGAGGTLGSAAYTASSAYEVPLTISTGLTRTTNTLTLNQAVAPTWTGVHSFSSTARSSGIAPYLTVQAPADTGLTASTEAIGVSFLGATRQHATGALTTQREYAFAAPTYSFAGTSTLTTAATVAIVDAPAAGTNATITSPLALWVQAGTARFKAGGFNDSSVELGSKNFGLAAYSSSYILVQTGTNNTGPALTGGGSGLSSGVILPAALGVHWSSSSDPSGARDTGFVRASARVARVTDGSVAGTNRGDLEVRSIFTSTKTPASASDTGTAGEIAWDSSFIYVCVATNTWKRVAIATW